jgi:hypothetical protein
MSNRMSQAGSLPPLPDLLAPPGDGAPGLAAIDSQDAQDDPVTARLLNTNVVATSPTLAAFALRSLRAGCYLLNYTPHGSTTVSYDGTMRVEAHSAGRTASGDLYQRPLYYVPIGYPPTWKVVLGPAPSPSSGVPIFGRKRYRYYLRVTQVLESFTFGSSFTLGFQMYRHTAPNSWVNEGTFTAKMTWTPAPAGFPSPSDYLVGDVRNAANTVVGRLTMGWVSKYLRRATVEVDRVSAAEAPLSNGSGVTWQSVFNAVGWEMSVVVSDPNVSEPSGEGWSDAELHQGMLARRDATNLDTEWRYHCLAVRRLDSTSRGIMYDVGATDSNNVPREGASLSSHWVIPNADPWGLTKGQRFGTSTAAYFRTAIHEVGHAMGLYHNTVDNGFMNTTDVIAASGTAATPFPTNVLWAFAPDDQKRLRHYPDIFVRPGGTAFGTASTAAPAISPTDREVEVEELELRVVPVLEALPLGAPVRANVELVNLGTQPQLVPASLSLKDGFVSGTVTDSAGNERTFRSLFECIEEQPLTMLLPGDTLSSSVTLLRGREGALFPSAGPHTVHVEVRWAIGESEVTVRGSASVIVTGAVDEAHALAANAVLTSPDALLTLVIGGDHLDEGIAAIRAALNNPVLRPHFAYIEAKRVSVRFGKRKADVETAARLLDEDTVMSSAEMRKAQKLVEAAGADSAAGKAIAKALDRKPRTRSKGSVATPAR